MAEKKNRASTSVNLDITDTNTTDANDSSINIDTSSKEIPYAAEYAKSGRATCRGCKEAIAKDTLRMAVRFPSKIFDGYQENWHHFECFWKRARKNDINEASIRGMEWLKWEDQELIRQRMEELKSSDGGGYTPRSAAVKVEFAKSGAGKCHVCKEKIEKGELRIASRSSFFHPNCFQSQNTFTKGAAELVGYEQLDGEDKEKLDQLFPAPQTSEKKRKLEGTSDDSKLSNIEETPIAKREKIQDDKETRNALKKQSELLWKMHNELKENLSLGEMEALLHANNNYKSKKGGTEGMLHKLVDMIVFGAPGPCTECGGTLSYRADMHSYRCSGSVSQYTGCPYTTREPRRVPFKIPKEMKKENDYLKAIKSPMLPERLYSAAALVEPIVTESKAFKNLNFAANSEKASKSKGNSSGGGQKMIVKDGYVVDPKCTVCTTTHVYVDTESKRAWQANLSSMEISAGRNSYYKLQIVKDDHGPNHYLFRSWGRIGTDIGGSKTEDFGADFDSCRAEFKRLFLDKTHNEWDAYVGGNFKKAYRGMDVLEVDFRDKKADKQMQKLDVDASKSMLPREVKELIAMVFDINAFNSTLKEFEIDMEKMPVGRLSKEHILKAYRVLTELQQVLEVHQATGGGPTTGQEKSKFIDFTNRFYTLIPHASGLEAPPPLNNLEVLKEKTEMLDNLLEIEIAYSIIKSDYDEVESGKEDAFDSHYQRLECTMEVVDQRSKEFEVIKRYLENTHATTHDIKLEIVNVLKIQRNAEVKRFKKDIGNRHLLWHGSRLSNYAGILSQGLRIAPPEAPVTGYMFGKGIYTADMVTKSANYCYTMNGEGLLLLCDVALGEMQLEKNGKDIKKPKRGKNSVKGLGGTLPNPTESEQLEDGLIVPSGKPIKSKEAGVTLLYNEYIVYDEAQVQLRYVVRVKFNNKFF